MDSVYLANTDSGYPDYLEIEGPGTYVCALIDPKMPDEEGEGYYKPIVGRALPLECAEGFAAERARNHGAKCWKIHGGGRQSYDGQVPKWNGWPRPLADGKIDLQLQTTQGVIPVSGTFSSTVVPTW